VSDIGKFPVGDARQALNEAAAGDLARELLAAVALDLPRPVDDAPEALQPDMRTRVLRDPDGVLRYGEERLALYPEHLAFAAIWLSAVGLGLWRWVA
jgi:hypothetical protein